MNGNNHTPIDADECARFQAKLPELFGAGADLSTEKHLQSCENCAELVRDLEYIAQQAKLLMPIHDPSPAVWNSIKSALGQQDPGRK